MLGSAENSSASTCLADLMTVFRLPSGTLSSFSVPVYMCLYMCLSVLRRTSVFSVFWFAAEEGKQMLIDSNPPS